MIMFKDTYAFSGFSVNDLQKANDFYQTTLGLMVDQDQMGLHIHLKSGAEVFVYSKPNHTPADYTILNFVVDDIDAAVDSLTAAGVAFERYDSMPAPQDEKGILRGKTANQGPDIAWFKDPAGNILSVLSN